MARIKINISCNVLTDEHSNARRVFGRLVRPEITIPSLRARLSVAEARALARDLAEAVEFAAAEPGEIENQAG